MTMRSAKWFISLGIIIALGIAGALLWHRRSPVWPWLFDYPAAAAAAAAQDKVLVAYLYTDWCSYCKQMERETFRDSQVIEQVGSQYVWVKLNTETDPAGTRMAEEFAVASYPTFLLLNQEGEELERLEGYYPPDQFAESLKKSLEDPSSLASLRELARQEPDSPERHFRLANSYLQRRTFQKAGRSFARVVELDPDNHSGLSETSRFYFAYTLASEEKHTQALEELDELERRFPQTQLRPNVQLLRGEVHHRKGDVSEARRILSDYLARYPNSSYAAEVKKLLAEMMKPALPADLPLARSH